jgi:hypothetical protein
MRPSEMFCLFMLDLLILILIVFQTGACLYR